MKGKDKLICCPTCNGKLSYGIEELVLHLKVINPQTGELQNRTKKRRVMNCDTRSFISCENEDCDFFIDDEDEVLFGNYFHLFEKVNKQNIDDFSRNVKS